MKANRAEEVLLVQNLLYEKLPKKINTNIILNNIEGILSNIKDHSLDKIKLCLGDFGTNVRKLVEHFNLKHPALKTLVSSLSGSISQKMEEALSLYESASEHESLKILELYSQNINKLKIATDISRIIDMPPLRAISDPSLRTKLRKQGKFSKVAGSIYFSEFESNSKKWQEFPDSMIRYVRLNEKKSIDLKSYKDGVARFRSIGMDYQANAYQKHIDSFNKKVDQYCGFYQIDTETLVGTIAKVHGFIQNTNSSDLKLVMDSNYELVQFLINSLCFSLPVLSELMSWVDGDSWDSQDPTTLMEAFTCFDLEDDWMEKTEMILKRFDIFKYSARVYMASNSFVNKLISPEMSAVMDQLERFHDYDYLPLFDYFIIVVPSIQINENFYNKAGKGYFINDGKFTRDFATKEDASVFLDFLMVKNKKVSPILIGQKEDQQYFIGYC